MLGPFCYAWPALLCSETQLLYAISTIPFLIIFFMILTYGVNIPFFDDWAFVDMIDKYLTGTLTFQDLWAQHNEHRPVTMKVVTLASASLTNWNLVSMMMFSAFVAFLTFVLVTFQIRKTFRILEFGGYGLLIIFSSLMLSGLSQYENWTWAIASHWFLVNFFAVSAFFLLSSPSSGMPGLLLAGICAVLSFMSMAHGLLALVLGLFMLTLQPKDGEGQWMSKRIRILLWSTVTVLVTLIYFAGFTRYVDSIPFGSFLNEPIVVLKYIAAYPASALLRDIEFEALILGSISLVCFGIVAIISIRKMWRDPKYYWAFMPWVSIGFYVAGTACLAAVGRHNYGWNHALCGRYTTMSALFYVALVVLLWGLMKGYELGGRDSRFKRKVGIAANVVVSVMIGLSIFSSVRMFHYFPDFQASRLIAKKTLLNGGDKNDLLLIFPDAEFVIEKAKVLQSHSLTFYKK